MASRLIIRWGMPQAGNRAGKTINSLQCWDQIAERGLWTSAGGTATTFRGHRNPNYNTYDHRCRRMQRRRTTKSSIGESQLHALPTTRLRNVLGPPASTGVYHSSPPAECAHACTVGQYGCPISVARALVRAE